MVINFFVFEYNDVISTLFYLKFNVLKKCIFDLNAKMTFSGSKNLTSEFDFEEKYGGHCVFASIYVIAYYS